MLRCETASHIKKIRLTESTSGLNLRSMLEVPDTPKDMLTHWVRDRVQLDYWLESSTLTAFGIEGVSSVGECVVTAALDNILLMRTVKGTSLHMLDIWRLVIESCKHSPDGFSVQVRTTNHSTWVLLKPHANWPSPLKV